MLDSQWLHSNKTINKLEKHLDSALKHFFTKSYLDKIEVFTDLSSKDEYNIQISPISGKPVFDIFIFYENNFINIIYKVDFKEIYSHEAIDNELNLQYILDQIYEDIFERLALVLKESTYSRNAKVNKLNSTNLKEDSELDYQITLRNLIGRKADSAHLQALNGSSFIPNINEIYQQGSYFYFSSHGSQLVINMDNIREIKKTGSNIYFYFKNKDTLSIKNIYPEF